MNRRYFIKYCSAATGGIVLPLVTSSCAFQQGKTVENPNFLFITADDMNYDSVGCYGCEIENITPNIDRLAMDGVRFTNAHVNIAVCQPCRQSLMTGRYPHRNGAMGFEPIDQDVPTLQEYLNKAGYLNGVLGKEVHMRPKYKFCWDNYITEGQLASGAGNGRSPELYYKYSKQFFDMAKQQGKPFFLNANSHDPHRPFAGSQQEKDDYGDDPPKFTRRIREDEVKVPGFLPDLPDVRKEIAHYFTSVHRCDQTVGAIMRALRESGLADNTVVMFLSDNGIAVPFAKSNCYLSSTKTPWIVSWPGRIKSSTTNSHLISGIDFMPTVLQAAGIEPPKGMDGTSFLPLLKGEKQSYRKYVFTEYHKTFAGRRYIMRVVLDKRFGYIFSPWSNVIGPMRMDSTGGLAFRAMKKAAKHDEDIAKRIRLFEYRVLEEFYDFENDPSCLNNLIDDPEYQKEIQRMRDALEDRMMKTGDTILDVFENRGDINLREEFIKGASKAK